MPCGATVAAIEAAVRVDDGASGARMAPCGFAEDAELRGFSNVASEKLEPEKKERRIRL